MKWLYGEETAYLTLLAPPAPTANETTSTLGPRPAPAAPCSLCDHPPNNALAQCACGHLYCGQHGGTCACNFTGCGLCLAHHPCPLDAALSSPTLLEALDLARATVVQVPEQAWSISEVATLTTSTATVITKMSVAKKVESELRKLPLRVIELTGRGRNRTGPRPQWPPKRVRHHPCTPQQRRKPQASPPVNETSVSAVREQRKVVPPQSLPTLDANTLQ